MSDNLMGSIDIKTPNDDTDYTLMLSEVSKYFKVEYRRMVGEMTRNDIRRLWYILHGRSK
jgi:hypothetical protein